jgi:transposase
MANNIHANPVENKKKENLSKDDVNQIIRVIVQTTLSYRNIANQFGVSLATVLNIKNGVKKYRRTELNYPLRSNN